MKGLELSRAYYHTHGRPMLTSQFGAFFDQMCVGLVGEGSECFGFDDELSHDHDFGPRFCIWLPRALALEIGEQVEQAYRSLPRTFMGYTCQETARAGKRSGVFSIEFFCEKYVGSSDVPRSLQAWLEVPEHHLAIATNGELFEDGLGTMTQIRKELLAYYPLDVLRKKLAAYTAQMAQAGQYNLERCIKRGDVVAIQLARTQFLQATFGALFLLARAYKPFYKWQFYALKVLQCYPDALLDDVSRVACVSDDTELMALVEKICIYVRRCLNTQGFAHTQQNFLQVAAEEIMASIRDPQIQQLHILKGGVSLG